MELKQFINDDNLTPAESVFNNHMNQIAIAFSEGRISAMVGTGFSRNAKTKDASLPIPMWPQIGQLLMDKLGIKTPQDGHSFVDPIRLSSLYVAEYNETELDNFLSKVIDDSNFEPDEVHKKFVELNWNDIYTTNYDTLIERADQITQKRFSLIKDDKDFSFQPKPRIIKLHGSFPSDRPFIMTEEQFRTYPTKHPIFVNSVQQTFIEDTVVLLGFSGTDPNFIKWSGWIRDNLDKKNAKIIYLISVHPLSDAEIKYFKDNNITILDLSLIKKRYPNKSIPEIFVDMFNYWDQYPGIISKTNDSGKSEIDDWINNLWKPENSVEEEIRKYGFNEFTKSITQKWQTERESYPNNIILPQNYNNQLFWKTRDVVETFGFLKNIDNNEVSINFLYEFDWRWNLCNIPLFNHTINAYKKAVGFTDDETVFKVNSFTPMVQKKAIKLLISLYKACREDGDLEQCKIIEEIISNNINILEEEDKNLFYYERILNAYFNLDYKSILDLVTNWKIQSNSIIWSIKKAGLLAEIGNEIQAVKILQENLQTLKNKLEQDPLNIEYLSQENLVNWLLIWIINSKRFDNDFPNFEINEDELRERNKVLASYKCDVVDILNSYSKDIYAKKQKKIESKEFDVVYKSSYIINSEEAPFASFIYINIFEKIGFPYRINISTLSNADIFDVAINNILGYQPDWALNLIIRSYNENSVEQNIGFEKLKRFTKEGVSEFVKSMLNCFNQLQEDLKQGTNFGAKNYCNRLIKTFPELLSRLCVKINSETKDKLIIFLVSIIKNDLVCRMPNIENFIKRFINTFTVKDKEKIIPYLLCLKAPTYRPIDENRNLNPFLYLYPKTESEIRDAKFNINQADITNLIERYSLEENPYYKKWYLTALITISKWNALDEHNKLLFGEKLWKKDLDEYQLPKLQGFYKSIVLQLPHPTNINVNDLYSKMLIKTKIPSIANQGVVIYPLDSSWYHNICQPQNTNVFSISFWENIFCMIEEQWNKDSKYLTEKNDPFDNYKNSAKENFRYSALVLKKMIVVNTSELNDSSSNLFRFKEKIINQINLYINSGIKCLEAKAALLLIDARLESEIYHLFKEKIASSDRTDVVEVLNSIYFLLNINSTVFSNEKKKNLANLISDAIFWQSKGDLEDCMRAYTSIIKLKKELVTKEELIMLCTGLSNIRKTLINYEGPIDVQMIKNKSAAAGLAHEIHNYFIEINEKEPEEIENWKNIAFDENEFVEIQNQWKENI